jgi:hypothetical protein
MKRRSRKRRKEIKFLQLTMEYFLMRKIQYMEKEEETIICSPLISASS